LAVVTGGHAFDVPAFRELLSTMKNCDVYIQDLDNWAASKGDGAYDMYDAFLFYNMNYWGILSVRDDMDARITDAIAAIGESRQGIVVLHHALLSFTDMPAYSNVCGIAHRKIRGFGAADLRTHIELPDHPITKGLADWTMHDEYFVIDPPGDASQVLLTTDHPQSMKPIGWTHPHRNARVFCYQSGHGPGAYANETYREVLSRGIAWVAGRI
jgi:type 1 glutamine amidotransferase